MLDVALSLFERAEGGVQQDKIRLNDDQVLMERLKAWLALLDVRASVKRTAVHFHRPDGTGWARWLSVQGKQVGVALQR